MPRALLRIAATTAITACLVACGGRTGLTVGDETTDDAGALPLDATPDAIIPGVARTECEDASETRIHLLTEENELYSFFPPSLSFEKIGHVSCPEAMGTPFSMGVDRKGVALALFDSGQLYRIDTTTARCVATSYEAGQGGWNVFGMGYARLADGSDALFVTESSRGQPSKGLATIETTQMRLELVHAFSAPLPQCELTGTGDGRLFAFCRDPHAPSVLARIDPSTAEVTVVTDLALGDWWNAWAFAFWGGDFWFFTGTQSSGTIVTKYDPTAKTLTRMTTLAATVVGAGVSTCAPH